MPKEIKKIELKEKIERGDVRDIARITGLTADYVQKVLRGTRYNKQIIESANAIGNNRRGLLTKLSK